MKLPRTDRDLKATVAVVVLAALALATVSCRKKSDAAAQPDHTGTNMQPSAMQADHGSTTGMDQSMPGMKKPTPAATNTPATGETNMGNMPMPGGEHTGHATSTNELVPGRSPVD